MKNLLIFSAFIFNFSAFAVEQPCENRTVFIYLETKHVEELKALLNIKSNLPYTFQLQAQKKSLSKLAVSYRRKSGNEKYHEPTNPDFFKAMVNKLSSKYVSLGIRKLSAEIIPGKCL